jgi:primosomal protein N'
MATAAHGTSEMPGTEKLREHLQEVFPETEFVYRDRHPRTWTVRGT